MSDNASEQGPQHDHQHAQSYGKLAVATRSGITLSLLERRDALATIGAAIDELSAVWQCETMWEAKITKIPPKAIPYTAQCVMCSNRKKARL